jgi:hypothetical protein
MGFEPTTSSLGIRSLERNLLWDKGLHRVFGPKTRITCTPEVAKQSKTSGLRVATDPLLTHSKARKHPRRPACAAGGA